MRQRSTAVRWLGFTAAAGERGFLLEVAFHASDQLRHEPAKRRHALGSAGGSLAFIFAGGSPAFIFAGVREDQVQRHAVRR